MVRVKKEEAQAFTVKFPKSLLEEIDQICAANYITRTAWLIKVAKQFLEEERIIRKDEILAKIANKENK